MNLEMIEELRSNIGKEIVLHFFVGGIMTDNNICSISGELKDIRRDNRILEFREQMAKGKVTRTMNLREINIFEIEEVVEPTPVSPSYIVHTVPCPYCRKDVHIIERKKDGSLAEEEEDSE
jgi:hypothetical protein